MAILPQGIGQGSAALTGSVASRAARNPATPSLPQTLPTILKAPTEEQMAQLHYDQPPRHRSAADRYQQVLAFEHKEKVAELFSVDLYA